MIDSLKIRKAISADAESIHKMIMELAEYEKLLDEVSISVSDLEKLLESSDSFVEILIAEYENSPVGYALYFHNYSTFLGKAGIYLEDLFVKPEFRGEGIGRLLLEYIIKIAKERNCGRVEWSVLDWNEPAIEFYKNRGAHPLENWKIFRLTEDKF
jgi:GNAT superfamily N-acetyltransferase